MMIPSEEPSFDEVDALHHVPINDALDALDRPWRRKLLFALLDIEPSESSGIDAFGPAEDSGPFEFGLEANGSHLSKLADYGFVDWNRDTHRVRKGRNFDDIRPLLELLVNHEDDLPDGWF